MSKPKVRLTSSTTSTGLLRLHPRTELGAIEATGHMLAIMESNTHRGADMVRQVLLLARGRDAERARVDLLPLLRETAAPARGFMSGELRESSPVAGEPGVTFLAKPFDATELVRVVAAQVAAGGNELTPERADAAGCRSALLDAGLHRLKLPPSSRRMRKRG